jgi:DNA-binding XRE family transcriptional regulator
MKSEFAWSGWADFPVGRAPRVTGTDAREARRRLRINQSAMANHMGVSVRTVGRWERNPDLVIEQPCFAREINAILRWS